MMFTNVFTKTLRDDRRALIGWGTGVFLTIVLMAAVWPSFADIDMTALLDQYPGAMKDVFNIQDMSTGSGYLNTELYSLMLPAIFIIFAVGRGARLIAGEEELGTLEVLVSLPLPRRRILLEKAAALAVSVGVLALVLLVSIVLASAVIGMDIPVLDAFYGTVAMYLLGLEFGFLALALSAATGHRALSMGVSAAAAGLAYLLFVLGQIAESVKPFLVLSPFHHALSGGPIGPTLPPIALMMLVVGVVALAVAVPLFDRRDLVV